jgi:hypothetical protein
MQLYLLTLPEPPMSQMQLQCQQQLQQKQQLLQIPQLHLQLDML